MVLRFKLQLMGMADDQDMCVEKVVVLDKEHHRLENIGRSLACARALPEWWPTTRHQGS